jgi:transposase
LKTRNPFNPKTETLRQQGCLNPKPEKVTDKLFVTTEFFDPCDLLQVKYEIVRRVKVEGQPIKQVAQLFGFSRPTVYQSLLVFEQGGIAALLPRRPGPRRAHKLNEEIVSFLNRTLTDKPGLQTTDLVKVLYDQFGLSVHPTSIDRALRRHEKKRL